VVETNSTMPPLGMPAPPFSLPDTVSGRTVTLDEAAGPRGLLVAFICNHCPYAVHGERELARIGREYVPKGVGVVAICSNDAQEYPDDSVDGCRTQAARAGFEFPYLYDETQSVAKAYRAACTPDFFLFDGSRRLYYRGRLDGTRPGQGTPDGADLRAALEALVAGRPAPVEQRPSLGCNIKWRKGAEPEYFRR
jgi:peroxiredoxin